MWDFINNGINYTNYIDTLWISNVYIVESNFKLRAVLLEKPLISFRHVHSEGVIIVTIW